MKRSLETLKRQAQRSTKLRGHSMRWQEPMLHNGRLIQDAFCIHCQGEVQLDSNPPANGIDIAGTAVAISCPIEED